MLRFLPRALALLGAAALMACLDGWWQPSSPVAFFRREMMGFAVLGAWLVALPLWGLLHALPAWRRLDAPTGAAAWLGLGVGAAPMMSGLLGWPGSMALVLAGLALAFVAATRRPLGSAGAIGLHAILCVAGLGLILTGPMLPPSVASLTASTYDPAADPRPVPPSSPDVVLVSVDTLRADAILGTPVSEGGNAAPTPYLDSLRERSMWAEYALSSSNQTLPGHVGMLTGADAMAHGVRSNMDFPDPELPLLSEIFHDAGYATCGTISNALLSAATGMTRGFDLFSDEPIALGTYGLMLTANLDRSTWIGAILPVDSTRRLFQRWFFRKAMEIKEIPIANRVLDAALPQIETLSSSPRPFFAFVHLMDPHTAYRPPADLRGSLSGELEDQVAKKYLPNPQREIGLDLVRLVEEGLLAGDPDAELAARYYHLVYLEEVIMVDRALERLEAKLQESGRPYVMLITADHGEQFGEHKLMEHANSLYEENLRVPFILTGPLVVPGQVPQVPILADVAPTLLWLAGQKIPDHMTGAVVDMGLPPRPSVQVDQKEVAIRDAQGLKWTGRWSEEGDDPAPRRLVHLHSAEGEAKNLLEAGQELSKAMMSFINKTLDADTWSARQANAELNSAQAAMVSQLGYADQVDDR